MTDGGDCNIPIAFLKKCGDKSNNNKNPSKLDPSGPAHAIEPFLSPCADLFPVL